MAGAAGIQAKDSGCLDQWLGGVGEKGILSIHKYQEEGTELGVVEREDRSLNDYVGESLRCSRLSRMVGYRCHWDNQGEEGLGSVVDPFSIPPLHPAIPKLPTRWRTGAGRPPLLLRLLPSNSWASTWASSNFASLNSPRELMYWGHELLPHPSTVASASSFSVCRSVSAYTGVSPCSGLPQLPQPQRPPGFHRQIRPQTRGLPINSSTVAPHALLLPDHTLG